MKTLLSAILGVVAIGVLLIAYSVFGPRMATADSYAATRPALTDRLTVDNGADRSVTPGLQVRCEAGQRAVIRQVSAAAMAECIDDVSIGGEPRASRASLAYPVSEVRTIREVQPLRARQSTSRRTAVRVDHSRDWARTAMVIGGSSAAGAGLGAIFGGKKGALIGAAIGGGAGTIYEVRKR